MQSRGFPHHIEFRYTPVARLVNADACAASRTAVCSATWGNNLLYSSDVGSISIRRVNLSSNPSEMFRGKIPAMRSRWVTSKGTLAVLACLCGRRHHMQCTLSHSVCSGSGSVLHFMSEFYTVYLFGRKQFSSKNLVVLQYLLRV